MQSGSTLSGRKPEPIPDIAFCAEKQELLRRFVNSVQEIGRLQQIQMESLMRGEPEFDQLEVLLHEAGQRKDAAKYALLAHIDSHHC